MRRHLLLLGDCLPGLRATKADSFDLVVTSPPYGTLRRLGGHLLAWKQFEGIATELLRVVRAGGVVCWQERDQIVDKGYSCLSWQHALFLRQLGFLMWDVLVTGTITARFPIARRYSRPLTYVFVLSRGEPTTVNKLRDRPNKLAGKPYVESWRGDDGKVVSFPTGRTIASHGPRSTVWLYPAPHRSVGDVHHPALMHEALARDLIMSYSKPGDVVCDPFAGACTTGRVAALLGRSFHGWEIHEPYYHIGETRLKAAVELAKRGCPA